MSEPICVIEKSAYDALGAEWKERERLWTEMMDNKERHVRELQEKYDQLKEKYDELVP